MEEANMEKPMMEMIAGCCEKLVVGRTRSGIRYEGEQWQEVIIMACHGQNGTKQTKRDDEAEESRSQVML